MPHDAESIRQYRKDNPEYVERQRRSDRAKKRALLKLKNLHEAEFNHIMMKELRYENERARPRTESQRKR